MYEGMSIGISPSPCKNQQTCPCYKLTVRQSINSALSNPPSFSWMLGWEPEDHSSRSGALSQNRRWMRSLIMFIAYAQLSNSFGLNSVCHVRIGQSMCIFICVLLLRMVKRISEFVGISQNKQVWRNCTALSSHMHSKYSAENDFDLA